MGKYTIADMFLFVIALLAAGVVFNQPANAANLSRKAAADDLFTNAAIRHLRIDIPEEGMATLRKYYWRRTSNSEERVPVPATVREETTIYTNVTVHLKGAAGSFRPVDSKPGLTLKFDKFGAGQRFHGLDKISLNNSVQDPTYISDKLCRELYAQAGVPAPRADYASVELNGRYLGLYVLTEGWDKTFLKRHFKNTKGNLYDPIQAADINKTLHVVTGEHPEDQSELKALCQAATNTALASRIVQLQKLVDLDRFLSLLTLDVMLWNWDGYAINKNNYRIFHDLDTHRLVFMPHGMDQMFGKPDGPIVTGRNGLLARALLQTAEGRRLYLDRFTQLRTNVFQLNRIIHRVDELAARIRPVAAQDGLFAGFQHDNAVRNLRQRILQRARSIDEQLTGVKRLLQIGTNEVASLSGWEARIISGNPVLDQTSAPSTLHVSAPNPSGGVWRTTVWLEEGSYTLEGRIKTRGVVPASRFPLRGAGLRVVSPRKQSDGVHWSWFPFSESRDYVHRGEVAATNEANTRVVGTTGWTAVTYDIELRQPIADLEVLCELFADAGEAWFDLKSLKLTRKTDICP